MLHFWSVSLSIIMPYLFLCAELEVLSPQQIKLQECLKDCWGVDFHTTAYLCQYFEAFLKSKNSNSLIEDFINKSNKLNIQFPINKKLIRLSSHDGVIQATKFHPIVYETPYVRIMAGCTAPGEKEPFHTHIWKSLLVVFEDAEYYIEYANGINEVLNLQPGIYELPPEDLYACTNIGTKKENCLRFEVKEENSSLNSNAEVNLLTNEDRVEKANLESCEKEIAYFFGVRNEQPVMEAYISALQKLNSVSLNDPELLTQEMVPYLEKAYHSIAQQRNWKFDIHLAAEIELQIILGHLNGSAFETIQNLMVQLYTLVFQSESPLLNKAAMLRTFLYQYKANVLKTEHGISLQDQIIMLEIAKASKNILDSIK